MATAQHPQIGDDGGIRASDAERDNVVELLSEHTTSGRLTLAELEERVARAFEAKTRSELAALTTDLPAPVATPADRSPSNRKVTRWIVAMMGGASKRGRWRVAERLRVVAIMGGHDVDLRDAELESDDTTIVAVSIMGGSDIYVPDTVEVDVSGFSLMGGTDERGSSRAPRPGAPRIRIQVFDLMGGSTVWRLPEEARGKSLKEARKLAKQVG
ncbi:DUF1707 SHOCT-like domain-containing protein [Phytoactinopolyspora limicola]|uniref:DUF1707 SHOCT-like domain-containing protein n=1 Tax=Phytoactinopolyspora limicola TaxID=2715536 RepID=UPI00140A80A9|nr:DUF1707 domain-containing protein [Phytoactinopolyspora limicola]